jgi:pyridoxamine 5'-phosphate oxidase
MKGTDLIPPSPAAGEFAETDRDEDLFARSEPLRLFEEWFEAAKAKEPNDPNAMALATAGADGLPDVRMVLLKGVDERGFVFFTNTESDKGRELAENPQAALLFHWKSLRRQVRVRGLIEPVTAEEADAYFASRARDSQIGAWASDQSREMDGPLALEKRVAQYGLKFGLGAVPRPPHWSGYRIIPSRIEFWRDRPFRLHERLLFRRDASGVWARSRLFP